MAEFDDYADDYNRLLERGVALSGEGAGYFADYKARYLAERVAEKETVKILDYGCGVGNVSQALGRFMGEAVVHGYDPSPESLRQIPEDLVRRGRFSDDLNALDEDYDIILMAGVLHHIDPPGRAGTLSAATARLAPGGSLVVFEHNPSNPLTRRVVDACPFDANAILLPVPEAERLLRTAHLISLRKDYIVFFPRALSILRPLERYLGWCLLGAQYAMIGRKK